jgi:putative SOS response-associated peptidase YedK
MTGCPSSLNVRTTMSGLTQASGKVEPLLDLLTPYRADSMRQRRVSTRVNSVQNDDPACAEEYSPQMLF